MTMKIEFKLNAPTAAKVELAGTFTDWKDSALQLRKLKGGVWKKTVTLPPGTHEYLFIVDGKWQDDPECPARVANSFGTQNCVRVVS